MARSNFSLSDTHNSLIDDLKELCDLQTRKDVVENALMLLGWAATESAKNLSIASVDEGSKVYREVQTPALQGARMKAVRTKRAANDAKQKDVTGKKALQKAAIGG